MDIRIVFFFSSSAAPAFTWSELDWTESSREPYLGLDGFVLAWRDVVVTHRGELWGPPQFPVRFSSHSDRVTLCMYIQGDKSSLNSINKIHQK